MESTELKKAGLKVTHPRMRILEILDRHDGRHVSAEDIYRQLLEHEDDIGLATVYRVLTQFEAAGIVLKHNFEGGQAVYELDRGKHHDHMVDVETGKVIEFTSVPRAMSILNYGQRGDPASPHWFDQAVLYAARQFNTVDDIAPLVRPTHLEAARGPA